jgi:NAD(P)H-nitrite reductase large subunit
MEKKSKAPKAAKAPKAQKVAESPKAKEEKLDKTFVGSLRRMAAEIRAAHHWDTPTAASVFEHEADILDPKGADTGSKEDLEKQTQATKDALDKAEAVLANPSATPDEQKEAAEKLAPT